MPRLTFAQTYAYARQAGFDAASAVTMAAIAMGESGLNTDAVGDTTLANATWGPSIGLAQIRTLKADTGKGTDRDVTKLRDPLANMLAAFHISSGGKDFSPWTVYNTGKYRDFLGQAGAAAGSGAVTNTGQVVQAGFLEDWLTSKSDIQTLGLQLLAVAAGGVLVILGAWQALGSPKPSAVVG